MVGKKFDLDSLAATPEYVDCLCIGTSIIMSLEACHQSQLGKKVLMVDRDRFFGGAWKTIEIAGIKDVENAKIALEKAKEVGHNDEVFEKLAANIELLRNSKTESEAV